MTLVEVVVATAIFAFFLGSVISAVIADAHNGPVNLRRLQAANLAREGIQMVTQGRDTEWIKGNPFRVTTAGMDGSITLFTRLVKIDDITYGKKVTVTVSWTEGGETKNIKMIKVLTDWKAI